MLGKAHRFFREERVSAGVVLCKEHTVSNKVYFIGSGSVELQVRAHHILMIVHPMRDGWAKASFFFFFF